MYPTHPKSNFPFAMVFYSCAFVPRLDLPFKSTYHFHIGTAASTELEAVFPDLYLNKPHKRNLQIVRLTDMN